MSDCCGCVCGWGGDLFHKGASRARDFPILESRAFKVIEPIALVWDFPNFRIPRFNVIEEIRHVRDFLIPRIDADPPMGNPGFQKL